MMSQVESIQKGDLKLKMPFDSFTCKQGPILFPQHIIIMLPRNRMSGWFQKTMESLNASLSPAAAAVHRLALRTKWQFRESSDFCNFRLRSAELVCSSIPLIFIYMQCCSHVQMYKVRASGGAKHCVLGEHTRKQCGLSVHTRKQCAHWKQCALSVHTRK